MRGAPTPSGFKSVGSGTHVCSLAARTKATGFASSEGKAGALPSPKRGLGESDLAPLSHLGQAALPTQQGALLTRFDGGSTQECDGDRKAPVSVVTLRHACSGGLSVASPASVSKWMSKGLIIGEQWLTQRHCMSPPRLAY